MKLELLLLQNQSFFNTQGKTTLTCKSFLILFCSELNKKEIDVVIVPKGDYCVVSNWAGGNNIIVLDSANYI